MAWSCADCGQGVDCHVDPITDDDTEPLCYDCAEDHMRRRELWARKFGPMTREQVLSFEAEERRKLEERRRQYAITLAYVRRKVAEMEHQDMIRRAVDIDISLFCSECGGELTDWEITANNQDNAAEDERLCQNCWFEIK